MSEIVIRDATEHDLASITRLLGELAEHAHAQSGLDGDALAALFREMVGEPRRYRNRVACVDGEIVGFISVVFYLSLFHRKGTALINELVVDARHRRQGIGAALVRDATRSAMDAGYDEIEVGTEKDNRAAIEFYRRVGFDEEYLLLGRDFDEPAGETARHGEDSQ